MIQQMNSHDNELMQPESLFHRMGNIQNYVPDNAQNQYQNQLNFNNKTVANSSNKKKISKKEAFNNASNVSGASPSNQKHKKHQGNNTQNINKIYSNKSYFMTNESSDKHLLLNQRNTDIEDLNVMNNNQFYHMGVGIKSLNQRLNPLSYRQNISNFTSPESVFDDQVPLWNKKNNSYFNNLLIRKNLLIPLKFQQQNNDVVKENDNISNSFCTFGHENSLYLNIQPNSNDLYKKIEELQKQIEEKERRVEEYKMIYINKENKYNDIINKINERVEKIKKIKADNISRQKTIDEIKQQSANYMNYAKYLKEEENFYEESLRNEQHDKSCSSYVSLNENYFRNLEGKFHVDVYSQQYIIKNLQNDLIDYRNYIKKQTEEKKPTIQQILKELQETVNEINPDYKVNLYGSYRTGLSLPWSDMDTVITNVKGEFDENFLSKLYSKLLAKPWVKEHKYIDTTAIPIIKLVSNDKYNFHIDISVENENHFGLKTVELVKSYLKAYDVLEPIILALKTLLNNGGLNNPYTGGLSSYGLILMVVSYIQSEIENNKFNPSSPTILGETFLNVIGHYGIFFDYSKFVIICYPLNDRSTEEIVYNFPSNSHELIIIDPLNKHNNVAKSTFMYMNVKMAFMIAFMVAKEECECSCHYGALQNKVNATQHFVLKRIFNSVKRFKEANKNFY